MEAELAKLILVLARLDTVGCNTQRRYIIEEQERLQTWIKHKLQLLLTSAWANNYDMKTMW